MGEGIGAIPLWTSKWPRGDGGKVGAEHTLSTCHPRAQAKHAFAMTPEDPFNRERLPNGDMDPRHKGEDDSGGEESASPRRLG
jgi:hypothetical protein